MSELSVPTNNRVLVVDDNQAIHEDFRKVLAADDSLGQDLEQAETELFGETQPRMVNSQYDLDFASQGQEALEKVQKSIEQNQPYAMAFVDVRMPPGWDGVETTTHLWEADPDLQIVICTAYSDYSWDEMVEKIGQSDRLVILKKPFDNVEVLQLASALTEKWRLQQEAKNRLDQLESIINDRTSDLKNSIQILQQNVANYQRTEEKLRKSEERFKLIADNAADLIIVLDTEGNPEYFSPSVKYTLGHDFKSAGGKSVFEWVHPEDRESMMASVSASINNSECQLMEFRMQHRAGAWRHLEARICAIRDKSDDRPHLVIVGRDLSERKEMESQTAFLTKQLLDAREKDPKEETNDLVMRLESPLKSLSDRIQFMHDAVGKLAPLLEQQQQIAEQAAAKVDEEAVELKSKLPKAITESLENVEVISKMIADLKRSSSKE